MTKDDHVENTLDNMTLNAAIADEVFHAKRIEPEQATLIKQIAFQFSYHGSSIAHSVNTMLIRSLPRPNEFTGADFEFIQPYDYASRLDYAYDVVNVMRKDGWLFDLCDYVTVVQVDGVARYDKVISMAGFQKDQVRGEAIGETDALAIARAALIAVREWKKHLATKEVENTL
jgi:hypothetical protein